MHLQSADRALGKLRFASVAAVVLACSVVAACVDDGVVLEGVATSAAVSAITQESTIRSEVASPFATELAVGDVGDKGTLVHNFFSFLVPDPIVDSAFNDFLYGEVYSGLFRFRGGADGVVEPDLVTSHQLSDDGLVYTFNLKPNLRFSDGTLVTSNDVKWSWERALLPENGAVRAAEVLGGIVGAKEMLSGDATSLSGVGIVDDSTLQVSLVRGQVYFLDLLADPLASVLSQSNVESWGTDRWADFADVGADLEFDELPVGTGPFRIESFAWEEGATLVPNEHYWDGVPEISSLEYANLYVSSSTGVFRQPRVSEFDIFTADREIAESVISGNAGILNGESLDSFDAHIFEVAPRVSFLAFNTALPPYDDVEFRRALMATVTPTPAEEILSIGGPTEPGGGLLPPGFPGHGVDVSDFIGDVESSSGYERQDASKTVSFLSQGDYMQREWFAEFTSRWQSELGVDVEFLDIGDVSFGTYDEQLRDGTLQMRYVTVNPRYPDPHAILGMIPGLFGPNAESEETRELAAMLDDAAMEQDRAVRIAKYQEIERHVLDRALVIPVFWDDGTVYELVKPYISGYTRPAYHGSRYAKVTVNTTYRAYESDRLTR